MMTIGSNRSKRIVFQVADVHKPLLSISGCADMGFDCYLGEKERTTNLHIMRAWIRQDPIG